MSNPTSNFGWQMPTPTDLVTDLPADFEVFGQAVDSDFADLLGGTTGQVLSKTSNTDLDFTWVAPTAGDIEGVTAGTGITGGGTSGTVTITNDMATTITAAGDIVIGTGSGTYDNLPIGTTNQVLTADTTVSPYKVKWAAPAGGGKVLQVINATYDVEKGNSTTTYADTFLEATITPSSATSKVLVLVSQNGVAKSVADTANKLRLMRGATQILEFESAAGYTGSALFNNIGGVSLNYLDSPNTTSATTYSTQFARNTAAGTVYVQTDGASGNSTSTITLLEIGA